MMRTLPPALLLLLLGCCRSTAPVPDAAVPPATTLGFRIEPSTDPTFDVHSLATAAYTPTEFEAAFRDIQADPYEKAQSRAKGKLSGYAGKRVGWFGIIRRIEVEESLNRTRVLVESKYFDGLTDEDLQVVSIYGAGDFIADVPGTRHPLKLLRLARIIGVVESEEGHIPRVRAEYIRTWEWGQFTFMDYGVDDSNQAWVAQRQLSGDVYSRRLTSDYYQRCLGVESFAK
jgi:hypothetical protein